LYDIRQQQQAVIALRRLGGRVVYDYQMRGDKHPPAPSWLRSIVGEEGFGSVRQLWLADTEARDGDLARLSALSELKLLDLAKTQITDNGIAHVGGLKNVTDLVLSRTAVTDAGLRHLDDLTRLETLALRDTHVTDAGLAYLERLTSLKDLDLRRTRVSAEGVGKLQLTLPDCDIIYRLLTIMYDNRVCDENLQADFGFACLISGVDKTILFDTGGKGEVLLGNFEKMETRPTDVDVVVISHDHNDHTGGLLSILDENRDIAVYLPASCPAAFVAEVEGRAADVTVVTNPTEVCSNVFVIGPMGDRAVEQALVVDTSDGLIIITGCAHPGIVDIAKRAQEELQRDILMVCGGMHLARSSKDDVVRAIGRLKELGVRKAAPSHCTGSNAISLFEEEFGENFVEVGVGSLIRF
jgi:7,8-dihydropterin-6-yl-methyl-4-(beta-D-ribofuranosyl)aminobenzene 5'-phosphate synthase